jgi:hypothetical protein
MILVINMKIRFFDVITAVKILILLFWVVTPCGLVGRHHRFGGTYCHHLQA